MRRRRLPSAIAILVALALLVGACGGDDEDDTPTAAPPASEAPLGGGATPPSTGQLPPAFIDCMADQGYEIESSDDIHSAPQQVLQACFGSLHSGGGTP